MRRLSFLGQPHSRARGRVGEDEAVRWLKRQGYRVVGRNIANHGGEIDIVAEDAGVLCFVEVKARASATYGPAIASVPPSKQRRISRAAALYLAHEPTALPCRFDVVAMDWVDGAWRYELVRDAFQAQG